MKQNENLAVTIAAYAESQELKLADAIVALKKTPEWQLLIETEFFKEQPARLTHLRKDSALTLNADPVAVNQLKSINDMLDCIGMFSNFIRGVESKGTEIRAYISKLEEKSVGTTDA